MDEQHFEKYGKLYLKCRFCKHLIEDGMCNLFCVSVKPDIDGCTEEYIRACENLDYHDKQSF